MQIHHLETLRELIDDLAVVLKNSFQKKSNSNGLLLVRDNEALPLDIPFEYKPVVAIKKAAPRVHSDLCTLCSNRISYKKEQFTQTQPQLPYLILIHNDLILRKNAFFQNPDEEQMFEKIISSMLGQPPSAFLVREMIRCHFGAPDYSQAALLTNCIRHLQTDIHQFSLKGILVLGRSAQILFPDKQKLADSLQKVIQLEGIPAVISPGPSRLVYMQKNNFPEAEINAEKRKIFEAVKLFGEKVMAQK